MPTYTYPDGTKSVHRPKDGQVFTEFDMGGVTVCTWQWDDFAEQWFNISSGKPTPQNTKTYAPSGLTGLVGGGSIPVPSAEVQGEWAKAVVTKMPACECGAKHTQAPDLHLGFCPLYSKH